MGQSERKSALGTRVNCSAFDTHLHKATCLWKDKEKNYHPNEKSSLS